MKGRVPFDSPKRHEALTAPPSAIRRMAPQPVVPHANCRRHRNLSARSQRRLADRAGPRHGHGGRRRRNAAGAAVTAGRFDLAAATADSRTARPRRRAAEVPGLEIRIPCGTRLEAAVRRPTSRRSLCCDRRTAWLVGRANCATTRHPGGHRISHALRCLRRSVWPRALHAARPLLAAAPAQRFGRDGRAYSRAPRMAGTAWVPEGASRRPGR